MMPYPEFVLRFQAAARRQLMLMEAVALGMSGSEEAKALIARLQEAAGE